jgi:hypothetical protein
MESLRLHMLDYQLILEKAGDCSTETIIVFLMEELPYLWCEAYQKMIPRPTNIIRIRYNNFEYIYDNYSFLEANGTVPHDLNVEDRLVAVLGRSEPQKRTRDDYRLKGWVGATEKMYGPGWDKGHFIAHSIGGAVDRLEVNVFVQRRDLNRGWSVEGKRFREMEKYCKVNYGTFCFSRPLYIDQTSRPAFLEFGILRKNRELWVDCFDNR